MNKATNSRRAAALACAVVLLFAAGASAAQNPFDETVAPIEVGEQLPATRFVNQQGRQFDFASLRGQITLVGFIYTRCRDACPLITQKFVQLNRALGAGPYHFALVTIDAAHDTPPALAAYAQEQGAVSPRLEFLTGDVHALERFARSAGLSVVDNGRGELLHNSRLLFVSPDGRVADIVQSVAWDPRLVAAELQHVAGASSNPLARADFALTKTVAQFCGGSYQVASGIIDVVAVVLLVGAGVLVLLWMRRRLFAQGA
jgi:protein SCO1/2